MAKFEMVALKAHHYGAARKVGDRYFVPGETDRRLMKALGNADDAPAREAEPAPPKQQAAQTVRAAKTAAKKVAAADEAPKRSGYFTRRLQADEAPAAPPAAPAGEPVPGLTTPSGDADA